MPIPAGPLIAAGATLAGQAVSAFAQGKINKKTRRWNEAMYRKQRQDALSDWQMQNEYNSPKAQMQRYKDANLNPHLIYGQGDSGNSFQVRSADTPSWDPKAPQFTPESAVSAFQDTAMKKAQTDNLTAQNENIRLQSLLTAANIDQSHATTAKLGADTDMSKYNLGFQQETKDMLLKKMIADMDQTLAGTAKTKADTQYTLDQNERAAMMQVPQIAKLWQEISSSKEMTAAQVDKIRQEIKNLEKDGSLKQYEIELNKQGLQKNDSLFWRTVGKLTNSTGSIVDKALEKARKYKKD